MGYGDDLMITTLASKVKKQFPERQIIIGNLKKKKAYHSIIYENNPNISDCRKLDLKKPIHFIDYHEGNRPYINYKKSLEEGKYIWNENFKPTAGEIYFSESELIKSTKILNEAIKFWKKNNKKSYKGIIFLEASSTKLFDKQFGIKHKNLDWGYDNWVKLVNDLKDSYLIIHSNHENTKKINNIFRPKKLGFREACATIGKCDLYIGAHGGFAHVAAALKKKAIVYFGGWAKPNVLGYNFHKNLYYKNSMSPCGKFREVCGHCEEARKKITPLMVKSEVESIFK